MNPVSRPATFRPDIEGLRGIAVFVVVAFHCGLAAFAGGFIGVDVFFVVSGYLITGLLVAEARRTGRVSLPQFYARRVRRLLPACALMLAVTLVASAIVLAPSELLLAGRAARATAVYLSNVFFGRNAADYFAADVRTNPMLHTWSLAVEEQFYLFWPLLIALALVRLRSAKALVAILSAVTALSLAACLWATANTVTFAFYQLPARAWEFGVGGLASLLPVAPDGRGRRWWAVVGWAGVVTILAAAALTPEGPAFPGWLAVVPAVGTTAALVAGAARRGGGAGLLLDSAPLQRLGTLSYSWYLWHWPFLVLAEALFPGVGTAGKVVAATLALGAAALGHRLVENPIRFHPALVGRPLRSLSLAAGLMLGSVGLATASMWYAGRLAREPALERIAQASQGDIAGLSRSQCVSMLGSAAVRTCDFGDRSSRTRVVLFGDSHALQWFDPLQRIAAARLWELTTLIKSGCPASDVVPPGSSARTAHECEAWRTGALRDIAAIHPSLVVVSSASSYLEMTGKPLPNTGVSLGQWEAGVGRTLRALAATGVPVAWIRDNPLPASDVPTCLARSARHRWYPGGSCEMRSAAVLYPAVFAAEEDAGRALANVHFLDLTDQFCHGDTCAAERDGVVMYHDDNHLAERFSESLAPVLDRRLEGMLRPSP